jgi:hypothetical protein
MEADELGDDADVAPLDAVLVAQPPEESESDAQPPSNAFISKQKFVHWLDSLPGDMVSKEHVRTYVLGETRAAPCAICGTAFLVTSARRGKICGSCRSKGKKNADIPVQNQLLPLESSAVIIPSELAHFEKECASCGRVFKPSRTHSGRKCHACRARATRAKGKKV